MTSNPRVEPFQFTDIWPVAAGMRESDRNEIASAFGACPLHALLRSTQVSTLKWSIYKEDRPVGIFGVGAASMMSDHGSPWLLATDELESISREFLRQSRDYVQLMLAQHSFLENWVDVRNTTSIRWLKWCGFKFDEPKPFGVKGLPFRRFYMEINNV